MFGEAPIPPRANSVRFDGWGSSARTGGTTKGSLDLRAIWRVLISRPESTGYGRFSPNGGREMPDEQNHVQLATEIVAAYVRRNQVAVDQLPPLISIVHQALGQLGGPVPEPVNEQTPAVSARRSVHRDYVVCMTCGWKGQMLRRHLTTAHGLSVPDYRARWNLAANHPMTAPAYSERRSTVAKELGLGRGDRGALADRTVVPETSSAPSPPAKKRGRPRSVARSA